MKHALNITTTLILCGSMAQAYAQSPAACIPTPSCTSLGYTSTTSCADGLKCPFGNYWNCTHINKITELTNKITEQTNKITELEKVIETSQSQGEICVIGSILYSDKSCYLNPQKGKTPIGIVVYADGNGGGQALALKSLDTQYKWSAANKGISGLQYYGSTSLASKDYASCENTKKIIASGDKNDYPAAWAAHEYKTEGTNAGDWCLPAAGIFNSYYNNQTSINLGFGRVNGTIFTTSTNAWSSTQYNPYYTWEARFNKTDGLGNEIKSVNDEIRPVLEF